MRSTLVAQVVFVFCCAISLVLMGTTDPGSNRPTTQQFDAEATTSPCPPLGQWTGGGVRGLSEGEENIVQDNVSASLREAFINVFNTSIFDFESRHLSSVAPHSIAQLHQVFMPLASKSNEDCMFRMDPLKQLQCHLWGNKLNSVVVGVNSTLFSGVPASSLCSLFLSCALWKRGRHGRHLTPALLQSVFNTLRHDNELLNSSQLMLRNVIHGGANWHEYPWLPNRLKVCEDFIVNSKSLLKKPIDARPIFQGGDLTAQQVRGSDGYPVKHLAIRENGSGRIELTRTLTSLEAMSVLYHRATNGGHPQPIVYPVTSTLKECRTTAINMLLLSGDSMARQLFWRIVHLLRHGPQGRVRVPYGRSSWVNTTFQYYPIQRQSKWKDVIIEIYPKHDELHMFESLLASDTGAPYKRNTNTVHAFFSNVVERRRRRHCPDSTLPVDKASKMMTVEEEPLFYIVFLFDSVTDRPRTDALAPCYPAIPLSNATISFEIQVLQRALGEGMTLIHDPPIPSFRALGIRIPLHVHDANHWDRHESPTTFEWLARMATDCNVTTSASTSLVSPPLSTTSDWIVGEHPASDVTHLYRVATQLLHTWASMKRIRVAPLGRTEIVANKGYVFQPSDFRLLRLETPFVWLRNTTAKRSIVEHQDENSHKPGVFFSRLRVLDVGKVMLASGNVFHTPDGLHEDCEGAFWLAGAAMYSEAAQAPLRRLSRSISSLADDLMQKRGRDEAEMFPAYRDKFYFHPGRDCGGMGSLMAINGMLIDILNDERGR